MDQPLLGIKDLDVYIVAGILVLFSVLETLGGFFHRSKRNKNDWIQEVGSFLVLGGIIKPLIFFLLIGMGNQFFPSLSKSMVGWNFWAAFAFYLLIDDLLQYWYHRKAHENEFLWKLHRAHHQAEEMGFFVSYRNAFLYYLMMPNIWWVAFITFMGAGKAVALGLIVKQLVIIGSHSTVKWDKVFYEKASLKPIIRVLERIIITPAFHHAHHGKSKLDGVSDPNGNFGNMLSFWDQLFGTAMYTHQFPKEYGLQRPTEDHWSAAYLYPLVTSKDTASELAPGYLNHPTASPEPVMVHLEKGKKYLWCSCGYSKEQPFCDGSHHGTKHKPMLFEARRSGPVKLCQCKLTEKGPFCDNSHVAWASSGADADQ
ncbi:MAG: sterol desaturase family protein [Bacteroidota bacterium]